MMTNIKIEASIDATNAEHMLAAMAFLQAIGNLNQNAAKAIETDKPVVTTKPTTTKSTTATKLKTEKSAPVEETPKKVDKPKEEPKQETQSAPEYRQEKSEEGSKPKNDITVIRKKLAEKVGTNRDAIKDKLTEFGAANVTTLDEKHFDDFFEFLEGLK